MRDIFCILDELLLCIDLRLQYCSALLSSRPKQSPPPTLRHSSPHSLTTTCQKHLLNLNIVRRIDRIPDTTSMFVRTLSQQRKYLLPHLNKHSNIVFFRPTLPLPHLCNYLVPSFSFATNNQPLSPKQSEEPPRPPLQHNFWITKLNQSIHHHPAECVASMIGLDILLIFGSYQAIQWSGYQFSAEFALAFALSRPLRRIRFPVEVAAASGLSKLFPSLTAIELTKLSNAMPQSARNSLAEAASQDSKMGRGLTYAKDAINKYGAAYMISSRVVGVTVILSIYEALLFGIDVQPYLVSWGYENVGSVLGQWAAAVVLSTTMYPLSISATAYIAPWLSNVRQKVLSNKP